VTNQTWFRYRVTVHTDDAAVLHAVRGLVHYCQKEGLINIAWGGTGEKNWQKDNHQVTFKFTRPEYRARFLEEAKRIIPAGWSKVSEQD
jgi:hypothetical protein